MRLEEHNSQELIYPAFDDGHSAIGDGQQIRLPSSGNHKADSKQPHGTWHPPSNHNQTSNSSGVPKLGSNSAFLSFNPMLVPDGRENNNMSAQNQESATVLGTIENNNTDKKEMIGLIGRQQFMQTH